MCILFKKSYGGSTHVLSVTLRRKVEVIFSGGIYTEVLRSKGRDVEIHLQDLPLRILLGQADGECSLCQLAIQCDLLIVGEVFNQLLGQCTRAADHLIVVLHILDTRTENSLRVNAGVVPKRLILRSYHRIPHNLWNVLIRNGCATTSPVIVIYIIEQDAVTVVDTRGLADLLVRQPLQARQLVLVIGIR